MNFFIPSDLNQIIGSETKDFALQAKRSSPVLVPIVMLFFGFIWLSMSSFGLSLFWDSVFNSEEGAALGGAGFTYLPLIFISSFVLVGIGIIGYAVKKLFFSETIFVGTPSRLIVYQKGKTRSLDWEQFNGNIELHGNTMHGSLYLTLRTGKMVRRDSNSIEKYVPDMIYICGIPDPGKIEAICRKRIKENDPTPANLQG